MNIKKQIKGFTLVELLVVIGIIAILFAVVLVAINPAKRFAESSNARRLADVNSILGGITTATVDNKGALPAGLTFGTTSSINTNTIKPRYIGVPGSALITSSTTPANKCYNVSTCSATGFLCTTSSDCPTAANANNCNSNRCTISGKYCTAESDCLKTNGCTSGACELTGNACTSASDCATITGGIFPNTCTADTVGYQKAYDLGNSSEGIVPTFIGAIPKDPGGSGFMSSTSLTFSDADTGYVVFNVPQASTVTYSQANLAGCTITGASTNTYFTVTCTTTAMGFNIGDIITPGTTTAQVRTVSAAVNVPGTTTPTNVTVSSALSAALGASESFTITKYNNPAYSSASNRIKVVSCNPNDADSDGSYTNNKIEVLR